MLLEGARVLLAVSGGRDSMVMLSFFHHVNRWPIVVAHCNFTLRGEDSYADEELVVAECQRLDVPCHVKRFATVEWAAEHDTSIQIAARELRYAWFEQLRQDLNMTHIATAHHAQDQAETLLFHLFRGAGLRGMGGIPPVNGRIIRPLLSTSREDIDLWAEEMSVPYRDDHTNLTDKYTRNAIRLHLLPLAAEINPEAVNNACRAAEFAREAFHTLRRESEQLFGPIDRSKSLGDFSFSWRGKEAADHTGLARFWLRERLVLLGFSHSDVDDVLECLAEGKVGRFVEIAGWCCTVERWGLDVRTRFNERVMPQLESTVEGCKGWRERADWQAFVDRGAHVAVLDYERAIGERYVRTWREGDRIRPLGMCGTKLVSDLLTDLKWPSSARREVAVLEICGVIAWVIGVRIAEDFALRPESERALVLRVV